MIKNQIIITAVIAGIFAVLALFYLFALPKIINLNSYKSEISKTVKTQTGLDMNIKNVDFKTNLNLSVDVFADDVKVNYKDGKPLLSLKKASLNVPLLALVFKNIEIKGVKLINPEISLTRDKTGIYSFESLLPKEKDTKKKQDFKLVNGIDIEIKNYKLNLDDYSFETMQKFALQGNLIKISDFNPEKYIKLETKGNFLAQNSPNIAFDIKFRSELPLKNDSKNNPRLNIDPLKSLIKYDFKTNINADLSLKNVQESPDINGFANFSGLSLKINDKILPESHGKINFKGKSFDIDSKLFITPESYILVAGKITDIGKNKLDLTVKTSDINLSDIKNFAHALNDVITANNISLNDYDLSGKLKADFKIADNSSCSGYLNIINTNISYKDISKPIKNINIVAEFDNDKLVVNNTYGYLDNNRFDIAGFIDSKNMADLKLNINSLNIKTILDLVNESRILKQLKPQFKDIKSMSGAIKVQARVNGKLNGKLSPEVQVTLINPAIVAKQIGLPISANKGIISVKNSNISLNGIQASVLQSYALISGEITDYTAKSPTTEITVKVPSFEVSKIKLLSDSTLLDKNSKNMLNSLKNLSGVISVNAKITPDQKINADLAINKISAYYIPSSLPLQINKSSITTDGEKIYIKSLNLTASNSPVSLSGTVSSLAKLPVLDLKASGYVAASDVRKYSTPKLRKSISAKGNLPLRASLAGYVDGWKLNSQLNINNLSYLANINNPGSKLININVKGTPASLTFTDSGLSTSTGLKPVSITGAINNYSGKTPVLNNIKVVLSNLDLSLVEPKGKLALNGTVLLSGNASKPSTTGNITVQNASIPSMYMTSSNIDIALKNAETIVNIENINVIDSKFKINLALENNFLSPALIVKNISVSSPYLNADKLQQAFPPVPNTDVPVIVKKGRFSAEKLLVNGLQTTNTSCDFAINPMNMLKATNLIVTAAGGSAKGKIDMNLKNSRVSVDLKTNNMEINTLATAFANMPNEIYGAMDGNIDVSTYGYTPDQTAKNAKGSVIFTVTDGKLTKLGSISSLLKAPNILSGGLGIQIIDNIVAFKEAKNSNQFKRLDGNISLNNGYLIINQLSSQGGDMSLYTKGSISMSNNYADITILGKLSNRITSKLGKIPDFSPEKLINDKLLSKIPGQWGQVVSNIRPRSQYPDIDKIPQLTRGASETDKHFVVKINGNFYKPGSVKSFKLID